MSLPQVSVLFVCLGNICRSPTAEVVFRKCAASSRLVRVHVDSCGTSGNHDGELPHPPSRACAAQHGLQLDHISRRVRTSDFSLFDYIVAMDRANLRDLEKLAPASKHKLYLFRTFETDADSLDVPDPWYTGEFERVFAICERASEGLLRHIVEALGSPALIV
jgi:protein-tyrosine phosphatase